MNIKKLKELKKKKHKYVCVIDILSMCFFD